MNSTHHVPRGFVCHNKLVRDLVPDSIRAEGRDLQYKVLSQYQYKECLRDKLREEVGELIQVLGDSPMVQGQKDRLLEEMADVEEVLHAIKEAWGVTSKDLNEVASIKRELKGAFESRLYLEYSSTDPDNAGA